jgi:hypothetical protein
MKQVNPPPSHKWSPAEEAAWDRKIEQSFRSQREIPNGRDYRWNTFRYISDGHIKAMRRNFDTVFPKAPGGSEWLDSLFCPVCSKRKAWCKCQDGDRSTIIKFLEGE